MKVVLTALSLTIAAMGTAFAQEATVFNDRFMSTKTRASVHAETLAVIARGEPIRSGEVSFPFTPAPQKSALTRAEVRGDLMCALARGDAIRYGEAPPNGNYDRAGGSHCDSAFARSSSTTAR